MYKKEIEVRFSNEANEDYETLQEEVIKEIKQGLKNSFNMQLLKAIERTIQNLKIDPHYGTHISRKNIPKATAIKYKTDKLWKVNLPDYWRLIYTLTGDKVKIVSLILDFIDHKDYNKKFAYKKK